MNILISIPLIIAGLFFESCDSKSLIIEVEEDFTGKVYLILNDSIEIQEKIIVDENGVGIINSKFVNSSQSNSFRVQRKGKDISKICRHQSEGGFSHKNVVFSYVSFWVAHENERNKDDEYWINKQTEQNLNWKPQVLYNSYFKQLQTYNSELE